MKDEKWIETNDKLQSLKLVCFSNLVVCKFKMGENVSVIGITDQMLEVEPKHAKALYFRGQSQVKLEDFDAGVKTLTFLSTQVDDKNADFKMQLQKAIQARKIWLQKQQAVYGKMFGGK